MSVIDALKGFWNEVKAPWTFIVVVMTTAVSLYLLANSSLEIPKASYQFAAILIGGFVTKALIAVSIGAMRTMLLMVGSALVLVVSAITLVDSGIFKDAAVEGLLSFVGGGIVVLIGALLERQKGS